jgi:hypothetical protein
MFRDWFTHAVISTDADGWPQTIYPTGKAPARFWPLSWPIL